MLTDRMLEELWDQCLSAIHCNFGNDLFSIFFRNIILYRAVVRASKNNIFVKTKYMWSLSVLHDSQLEGNFGSAMRSALMKKKL